jgi:hypothetical protein
VNGRKDVAREAQTSLYRLVFVIICGVLIVILILILILILCVGLLATGRLRIGLQSTSCGMAEHHAGRVLTSASPVGWLQQVG